MARTSETISAPPGFVTTVPLLASTATHIVAIVAVGLVAYSNTFRVPFQFDDFDNILRNPAAKNLAGFLVGHVPPSRWIGFLSFALNGSIHGQSVAGYHAFNLAVHVATAVCVYFLAVVACRSAAPTSPVLRSQAAAAGLVAGLVFVAHPLHTQAVTYIVQRLASLVTLFYTGAALAYARSVVHGQSRRRTAWYVVAMSLNGLALFTKENAATLPVALAVLDVALLPGKPWERVRRLAPFALLTLAVVTLFLSPASSLTSYASAFREAKSDPGVPQWLVYLLAQPGVVLSYLRLLVLPVGQNVDHDPPVFSSPLAPQVLLSLAALTILLAVPVALAWRARSRSAMAGMVFFAVYWFIVALSVESSIIPMADLMFEHRVYLPSVGLCIAAGAGAVTLLGRLGTLPRRLAVASLAAWILALGTGTWLRNSVWRDRRTLWNDALAKSPNKSRPYVWVAQDLIDRGDHDAAINLLQRAMRLPNFAPHVSLTLGVAYSRRGNLLEAERAFRQGLARGGGAIAGTHGGLAIVLFEMGRIDEACVHFIAEVAVSPSNRPNRENAATCRYTHGDVAGAAEEWEKLAAEGPPSAPVLYNLALAHSALGDLRQARTAYQRFCDVADPTFSAQREAAKKWLAEHPGRIDRWPGR